eukprot:3747553-Alexandrium_andersonii.AAC.1
MPPPPLPPGSLAAPGRASDSDEDARGGFRPVPDVADEEMEPGSGPEASPPVEAAPADATPDL